MRPPDLTIAPEAPADGAEIDRLHARTFGPGRFARTAYRLREGARMTSGGSFVARVGTLLVASVRVSPVLIGDTPALALGPLAVDPAFERRGIGQALLEAALAAARETGETLVILVGDAAYYARVGFTPAPLGRLALPGPVDPARVLVCALMPGAFDGVSGAVLPRR